MKKGFVDEDDELSYFAVSFDPAKNSSSELVSAKILENVKPILVIKRVQELYLAVQRIVKTANNKASGREKFYAI